MGFSLRFFYTVDVDRMAAVHEKTGKKGASMNGTCIIFGLLFLTAGILFFCGKIHGRLSLWENMPENERQNIKIRPLCRNIGFLIALSGILFLTAGVFAWFLNYVFVWAMIGWMVTAGLDVLYIGKSRRYQVKQSTVF